MRRIAGGSFERLSSLEALWAAWLRCRAGKRSGVSSAAFELEADSNLIRLHRELSGGTYRPGAPRIRLICDPKPRLVTVFPFRDRVVHQALHHELAPLERSLSPHTYACLQGRGAHRAVLRFLAASRRYRWRLTMDVRRYFPSIHRPTVYALIEPRVGDPRTRALFRACTEASAGLYQSPHALAAIPALASDPVPPDCGIAIGSLLSQWTANFYLSAVDHLAERTLRAPLYQRYMDDLVVFGDDADQLLRFREDIADWLRAHRGLVLGERGGLQPCTNATTYLGYRVSRSGLAPGRRMRRRLRVRLRQLVTGPTATVRASLTAALSHARFG